MRTPRRFPSTVNLLELNRFAVAADVRGLIGCRPDRRSNAVDAGGCWLQEEEARRGSNSGSTS